MHSHLACEARIFLSTLSMYSASPLACIACDIIHFPPGDSFSAQMCSWRSSHPERLPSICRQRMMIHQESLAAGMTQPASGT